ncbi:MAG: amidohydrolase [Pseudomonadota bacterium]|nr:amidohydrolase [Gammaproteobacteria bacterium]MBU1558385.1 amidohydrolase [Gammaproteobacteria bacterium]MBU1629215.1 amidohydrolase [Gammaproteobacteria bacterium]MBU1927292.1 amidohydrolase [Gammaproteobacteria bacterium]MBU2546329.1 amidohydrolase [Gammaproteobacteria bacterium]
MGLIKEIVDSHDEMIRWRHDLHRYPEPSLHEQRTASKIAELLRSFGFDEVREKVGEMGVIGVLRNGGSSMIGLAAAFDGEDISERGNPGDYKSRQPKYMHALGHDGEVSMLLGAAKYLAHTRRFKGDVIFIFYSSYSGGVGARAIIEEGLFELYPVERLFTLLNVPELPEGEVAVGVGPVRSAVAELLVKVVGKSGNAAFPNRAKNPILAASEVVNFLETLTSGALDPASPLSICITSMNAGGDFDHIPKEIELKASVRFLNRSFESWLPVHVDALISKIAEFHGMRAIVSYRMVTPVTNNDAAAVRYARGAIKDLFGAQEVNESQAASLLGSDIGYFLNECPGACISIGNGISRGFLLTSTYDFNDDILPIGASVLARLVEKEKEINSQ